MSDNAKSWLLLLSRMFMGGMFITTGIRKWVLFPGSSKFVASMGVPFPETMLMLAIALEIIAGIMLVVGFRTKLAAIGLILFVVILTPIFHGPWQFQMPRLLNELDQCLKNLNLIGCMLLYVAFGPGRFSLDARMGRSFLSPAPAAA
jgi:putative oxidoreductase